ncbi:serine/threonine-protein kinase SRPK3 [Cordyceps javanica]|uniref:Serine/threonine-protein kinase SRPK3 n=1 Tax=Cordyceps javanica TaxID=43265 RepID=A0A545WDW4_9HYPO|nr:serine/threonine-protein kinase SRPK3 [Cordyceps javanica]TQW12179.1 serine/threonine-protein kinase SRPK3 [Cordyceps javanica]
MSLKILMSAISGTTTEERILHYMANVAPLQSKRYITELLDTFELNGPNGNHKCLVFEPIGPDVNNMVEELPQFNPRKFRGKVRYPPEMAKSILKQSAQALALLYSHGVSHGDLQPGNMHFGLDNIDLVPEDALRQRDDLQPLANLTPYKNGFKIKLSDMGGT